MSLGSGMYLARSKLRMSPRISLRSSSSTFACTSPSSTAPAMSSSVFLAEPKLWANALLMYETATTRWSACFSSRLIAGCSASVAPWPIFSK